MVASLLRNRASQEAPKLAPEVASLVHHIELNKAGWWIKGLRRLIVAALWTVERPQSPSEIVQSLRDLFAVDITTAELQRHLDNLCSTSQLLRMPNGAFNITQTCRDKLEKEMRDARELEQKAESSFAALLAANCPTLDAVTVWTDFRERLLEPMIHDLGAETYQLLTGGTFHAEKKRTDAFLNRYAADARPGLLLSISAFLDPKNNDVRAYTLRCMNAHFFVQAARLSEDVITKLGKLSKLNPTFRLFVDTNFVFSVFGLHDNPQADSALSLTHLREQLSGKASIQFHILQPTVDEARKVLISMKTSARNIRFTRNIVDAATVADMSGIMGRYLEDARRSGWQVTSDDYFDPLINNFISISRSKGIELHNDKLDRYRMKPEVIDDINDQLAYEKQTYGAEAKSYEKLEHDLMLWHFVNDQRSASDESPLDARCWVVTMDYRLINFDAHKRRRIGHPVPICVHPVALLQMLQFWVPRNAAFDEAMLSAMRYPLLSHDFDIDSEKVTVKILNAISQWSNASTLGKEAVTNILMNTALRDKLASANDADEELRLVREALVDENRRAEERAREARRQAEVARAESQQHQDENAKLQRALAEQADRHRERENSLGTQAKDMEAKLAAEQATRSALEQKVDALNARVSASEEVQRAAKERFATRLFFTLLVALPLGTLCGAMYAVHRIWPLLIWNHRRPSVTVALVWITICACVGVSIGKRSTRVRSNRSFESFVKFRTWWLVSFLGGAAASLVSAALQWW